MKNKTNFPFVPMFIALAASVAVLLPIRIYQYFKILESDTGFYSTKDFSVYLLYAVMAFITLFSIISAFMNRKNLKLKKISFSPVSGAVLFALTAIGLVLDAVSCFTEYLSIGSNYINNFEQTRFQYISANGGIIVLAEAIFGICAAVYFFALAGGYVSKKNVAPRLRSIALSLPLWSAAKLLMRFKTKISFINVSDLFIELFAIAFIMLFFLYFAQTMSEVDKGETYFKMYAYGIPAAAFSLTCFIPRFLLVIIGRDDLLCSDYGVEICYLLIPVMIISTLVARSYESKKSAK